MSFSTHDRSHSQMSEPPTQPSDHHLLYAVEDGVAWIQFNRPEQLNAFTAELYKEIKDTIRRAEADESIDTIVFTGTGRAFSTGGDLKSVFERLTDPDPLRFAEMADSSWFDVLKDCRKMTIAAVNGIAVAAGAACRDSLRRQHRGGERHVWVSGGRRRVCRVTQHSSVVGARQSYQDKIPRIYGEAHFRDGSRAHRNDHRGRTR